MNHFDEMTCLMYLEGQLDRSRALELSAHVDSCGECRALLRALERESKRLAQALLEEDEPVPARLLSPAVGEHTPWGWIVSFGLAAAGVYTVWTGIDQIQEQLGQAGFTGGNLFTMLLFGGVFWKGWNTVTNFIEILAFTTLGILAIGLLRRSWRRWTTITLVMGAVLFALALPRAAGAAEVRKGHPSIEVGKDEVIKNDLVVFGGPVRVDGTVDGDLIVFGEKVTVQGHVTGDVIVFCQSVNVEGQVDGSVRAFTNNISVSGTVARNVIAFAGTVDVDSSSKIGGEVIAFTGNSSMDGHVARDYTAFGGQATLGGFVGGNAYVHADQSFTITSGAQIDGTARFRGQKQPEVDPHAKLASPLQIEIVKKTPSYASWRFWFHQALFWGAAFVFGLVLILIVPQFFSRVVASNREYVFSPLLGFAALVGVPLLAIIVCITVVGLGVGIASILLWLVALYAAQTFVGAWIGEMLLKPGIGSGALLGRMALGLLVLRIAFQIPYLGGWIKFVVIIWGLGALALALFRKQQAGSPQLA